VHGIFALWAFLLGGISMAYLSLYRRWRSQSFAEVVGQSHIVRTLQNSLNLGRISHAYLFAGPRGTGKTTLARLFAKGLNCVYGPTANFCGECPECVGITQGTSIDVIEIDGASNRGIEEIRKLREQVQYAPVSGRYKVYIIDEVHMLTQDAFNALLKTLEEPPQHVVFILATTDPRKLPTTILSRCQRYDFKRFTTEEIIDHLQYVLTKEGVIPEPEALAIIAEHADGGMRDALSIVDQCLAYSDHLSVQSVTTVLGVADQKRIVAFLKALDQRQGKELFLQIQQLYHDGLNFGQFVRDILAYLRKAIVTPAILTENGIDWKNDRLLEIMAAFSECEREMRYVHDSSISLELTVLRLIQPLSILEQMQAKIDALELRVKELEQNGTKPTNKVAEAKVIADPPPAVHIVRNKDEQEKLQTIQAHWQEYLQMLRSERLVQPEAFLREGTPVDLKSDELIIAFPPDRGFHKASIEQDKHREPAERVLSRMFGCTLKIKCIISSEQANTTPLDASTGNEANSAVDSSDSAKADQHVEYDQAVDAALKLFGGKVIHIKND